MYSKLTNKLIALLLLVSIPYQVKAHSDIDIIEAIAHRDIEKVEVCLHGANPNQKFNGKTPLLYAIDALVDQVNQTDKKLGTVPSKMAGGLGQMVNGALIATGGGLAALVTTGNLYRNNKKPIDDMITWVFSQVNTDKEATTADKIIAAGKLLVSAAKKGKAKLFLEKERVDLSKKVGNINTLTPEQVKALEDQRLEEQRKKDAEEQTKRQLEEYGQRVAKHEVDRKAAEEARKKSIAEGEARYQEYKRMLEKAQAALQERTLCSLGKESCDSGNYDEAIKFYQQVIMSNPEKGHFHIAEACMAQGSYDRAIGEYDAVLAINTQNSAAKNNRAEAERLLQQQKKNSNGKKEKDSADKKTSMSSDFGGGLGKAVLIAYPELTRETMANIAQATGTLDVKILEKSLELTVLLDAMKKDLDAVHMLLMRGDEALDVGQLALLKWEQDLKHNFKELEKLANNINTLAETGINLGDIAHKSALITIFVIGLLGVGYGLKKIFAGGSQICNAPIDGYQHNAKINDAKAIIFMLLSHPDIDLTVKTPEGTILERVRSEMIKNINHKDVYEALSEVETLINQRLSIKSQVAVGAL